MKENIENENNLNSIQQSKAQPASKKMTILNFALIVFIFIALFIYMVWVDRYP